jgi:hypothetical protein
MGTGGVIHCATCGYPEAYHDLGTLRCPKETANKAGHRGSFKVPPPVDRTLWRDVMRCDAERSRQAIEDARKPYVPEVVPAPLIPARPPFGPAEFAGGEGQKQATKLGRGAIALGWDVSPWYWRSGYGDEGCALRLAKGPLRAVALWHRAAGNVGKLTGWKAEYAYAWRTDVERLPTKLNHTNLERLIR